MLLNDLAGCVDACRSKPIISGQLDLWFQPELRFAAGVLHVYVRTDLFAREEVESVPTHPENRRAHRSRISDSCFRSTSGLTITLSGRGERRRAPVRSSVMLCVRWTRPPHPARRLAMSSRMTGTSSTGTPITVWVVVS
jgi:hypothetical protein